MVVPRANDSRYEGMISLNKCPDVTDYCVNRQNYTVDRKMQVAGTKAGGKKLSLVVVLNLSAVACGCHKNNNLQVIG